MQESEAIARMKAGDIGGLETLVQLYQVLALDTAYMITRNHAMSEDIVQDCFLHAYQRIHRFDEARPFSPWFLRSVVNSALTAVANPRNRHLSLETRASLWATAEQDDEEGFTELPNLEPSVQDLLEAAETRDEILATLDNLPPEQRAAVLMRYYLDWTDAEVSHRLGIPPGTVRWRLHNAKRRLRRILANWIENPRRGESYD